MGEEDVTLGELARRIDGMGSSLDKLTDAVHGMDTKQSADFVKIGHLESRVASLEEWKRWAVRIIVAGVAAALLALVIN